LREFLSNPWHLKQVSERIGRTSRLNSTFGAAASAARQQNDEPSSARMNRMLDVIS
jgi:hypothetical protein